MYPQTTSLKTTLVTAYVTQRELATLENNDDVTRLALHKLSNCDVRCCTVSSSICILEEKRLVVFALESYGIKDTPIRVTEIWFHKSIYKNLKFPEVCTDVDILRQRKRNPKRFVLRELKINTAVMAKVSKMKKSVYKEAKKDLETVTQEFQSYAKSITEGQTPLSERESIEKIGSGSSESILPKKTHLSLFFSRN